MKIAFLGLGRMGQGMAARLARAGATLTVWNRNRKRCDFLEQLGASVADTPVEACAGAGLVFTMLADDSALASIMSADAVRAMAEDGVHVSHSTVSVALAEAMTASHEALGRGYLACPVFGRPDAAEAGTLNLCLAGAPEHKEKALSSLASLGAVWDFGDRPAGANAVKLAGNFMLAATIEMLGEAFSLAESNGVPAERFYDLMSSTLFAAPAVKNYGRLILNGEFDKAGFTARLAAKDIGLVREAARRSETPLALASLVEDRLLRLLARGWGDKDWCALAQMQREDAGLDRA